MIDIGKFAKPSVNRLGDGTILRFGLVTAKNAAALLQHLCDELKAGRILLQKVQGGQIASNDDWFMQAIYLEFAQCKMPKPPSKVKELYGSEEFPVAIAQS